MNRPDLTVVMPVYNEEASLVGVIRDWLGALAKERISGRLIVVNDGSRDGTLLLLQRCAAEFPDRMLIVDQPNSGHGRSCRAGYERALLERSPWIFQVDSDGQCDPVYFPEFWRLRNESDCVFGTRVVRDDGFMRKMISIGCRVVTGIVTGMDLKDPNVPYRLMKREALEAALRSVPRDLNLQNIALTIALKRRPELRWVHLPIRFRVRQAGSNSMNLFKIVKMGWGFLIQIRRIRRRG